MVRVCVSNVEVCWGYYLDYLKRTKQENNKSLTIWDFKEWVKDELYECPNCGEIVLKDDLEHSPTNTDVVCCECIDNGYYE